MNAGELADRLEQLKNEGTAAIANDDIATATVLNIEMTPLVWQQCEIIVKSLRFAADIERLLDCKDREIVFRKLSGGGIQVSSMWRENAELRVFDEVFSCVDDIYTAARNAVEKLEGK